MSVLSVLLLWDKAKAFFPCDREKIMFFNRNLSSRQRFVYKTASNHRQYIRLFTDISHHEYRSARFCPSTVGEEGYQRTWLLNSGKNLISDRLRFRDPELVACPIIVTVESIGRIDPYLGR